jgi:hypothetical protein
MGEESIFQKIAGAVGSFAPGIAAVLAATGVGAPIAGAIGAIGILAKQFGLPDTATHDDVLMAVQTADPETKLKIIAAENSFQLAKRDQDIKELQTILSDKQDARKRQTDSEKATGKRDTNLYVLAYLYTLGFFFSIIGMVLLIGLGKFPENPPQAAVFLIGNLFGALTAGSGAVMQYFFGSSKGSADKTDILATFFNKLIQLMFLPMP